MDKSKKVKAVEILKCWYFEKNTFSDAEWPQESDGVFF